MSGRLGRGPGGREDLLDRVEAAGWLSHLDLRLADLLDRLSREESGNVDDHALVALAGALVSRQRSRGHSCLHLEAWASRPIPACEADRPPTGAGSGEKVTRLPSADAWRRALERSPVVAVKPTPGSPPRPLVLDASGRLYLWRYHHAEQRLARRLRARIQRTRIPDAATTVTTAGGKSGESVRVQAFQVQDAAALDTLSPLFRRLFPEARPSAEAGGKLDWQAVAAAAALIGRLSVISGGPGTGKTTTVTRILALLAAAEPAFRFALAAPTGKAAARLEESIASQAADLPVGSDLRERIPRTASTLHRLLGYSPRADRFRHRSREPLRADVVVIDEASMVDLLMMGRLLEALSPPSRLILLGDRDQLASVETGFVFGDLCAAAGLGPGGEGEPTLPPRLASAYGRLVGDAGGSGEVGDEALRDAASFAEVAVELRKSYRFHDQPGIGALAAAIRGEDPSRALAVLEDSRYPHVMRRDPPSHGSDLLGDVIERIEACPAAPDPAQALLTLGRFRILAATRSGPWGVERLNRLVEQQLAARGLDLGSPDPAGTPFYPGRPVLVRANDYQVRLFNGDLGVVWPESGRLWAFFPEHNEASGGEASLRRLPLAKLPTHDTAWAMTVHQSQGSELDSLLLVLPAADAAGDLVSRELLYTGITRARHRVELVASREAIRAAIERSARRISGLAEALAEPAR